MAESGEAAVRDRSVLRTVIVDDHELLAGALSATLGHVDGFDVVGVASTIEDGVAVTARTAPDLLVADLRLGDGDVVDHLDRFRAAAPNVRVLVMSGMVSEGTVMQVLRAGADGFVAKSQPVGELAAAARRIADGEVVFPPAYMRTVLERGGVLPSRWNGPMLTPREVDVLQLLALGRSTAAVAAELHMAVSTMRNHLASAMAKLGAGTRLAAVAEAVRLGIVSPPAPVAGHRET